MCPRGKIDLCTVSLVRDVLHETDRRQVPQVFVDLSGVEFLAGCGVRVIGAASAQAQASRRQFAVVVATRPVRRVLELTGASDELATYECVAAALAAPAAALERVG